MLPQPQKPTLARHTQRQENVLYVRRNHSQTSQAMKDTLTKSLPPRLKAIRKEKGFTQETLADAAGLKRVQVNKFENGKCLPLLPHLLAMRRALKVPSTELLGE